MLHNLKTRNSTNSRDDIELVVADQFVARINYFLLNTLLLDFHMIMNSSIRFPNSTVGELLDRAGKG